MSAFEVDGAARAAVYAVLFAVWGIAIAISVRGLRRDSREERELLDNGVDTRNQDRDVPVPA
jgi:hypothetical protein